MISVKDVSSIALAIEKKACATGANQKRRRPQQAKKMAIDTKNGKKQL